MFSPQSSSTEFRRLCVVAAIAAIVAVAVAPSAHAQAVRGTLVGNVTDTSGAAMPGVTVTITDVNTNVGRTAVTNESGIYTFSSLLSGTYRVDAELQGFRKYQRENVKVDVNTTVRVDIALEVGQLSEQVTVTAETPALQTDRTDTGRIIEGKQVQEMPLAFNRNFQGILVTVPGATRPFRPHSQFFNSQDSLSTQVNGQSRLANNVQIEGLDNNHRTGLLTVLIPPPDALETVSVTTSNYDAEFGRSGGTTRSSSAASGGTIETSCCRRRTRAVRAASSSSGRRAPACSATIPASEISLTRLRRSCSTGRTPSAGICACSTRAPGTGRHLRSSTTSGS